MNENDKVIDRSHEQNQFYDFENVTTAGGIDDVKLREINVNDTITSNILLEYLSFNFGNKALIEIYALNMLVHIQFYNI